MVPEAISNGELYIRGCNFENPGSMNGTNILDMSSLVFDIRNGKVIQKFEYVINRTKRKLTSSLVDGIYPQVGICFDTIAQGIRKIKKRISKDQEDFKERYKTGIWCLYFNMKSFV